MDGIAQWDQLNNNLSGGTGYYSYSGGVYSCTGSGSCSSGGTGNFSYSMSICFLTKTYSSGSVSISGGVFGPDNASTFSGSFPTSGLAVIAVTGGTPGSSFSGTNVSIMNSGGVQGANLKLDLHYTRGTDTAVGSATTPFVPGGY